MAAFPLIWTVLVLSALAYDKVHFNDLINITDFTLVPSSVFLSLTTITIGIATEHYTNERDGFNYTVPKN